MAVGKPLACLWMNSGQFLECGKIRTCPQLLDTLCTALLTGLFADTEPAENDAEQVVSRKFTGNLA